MLDMVQARVGGTVVSIDSIIPVCQVANGRRVVDGCRDHLLPPVERAILVGSVLPCFRGAADKGRWDKMDRALRQAELGLGIVVGIPLHADTHKIPRSAIAKPKNIIPSAGFSKTNHIAAAISKRVLLIRTNLPKSTEPPANVMHAGHKAAAGVF